MVLDAAAPRWPDPRRPVRAFGEPASSGVAPEQATVLLASHGQLQANAFVAAEEREIPVRRCRSDDLERALRFESAKRRHQVAVDLLKELLELAEPRRPEPHAR